MIDYKMLIESISKFSPSISQEEIEYYKNFIDIERWWYSHPSYPTQFAEEPFYLDFT